MDDGFNAFLGVEFAENIGYYSRGQWEAREAKKKDIKSRYNSQEITWEQANSELLQAGLTTAEAESWIPEPLPTGFVSEYGLPHATKANTTIISNSSYLYWSGDIDNHSWALHGWSGKNAGKDDFDKSVNLEPYPTTANHGPRVTWNRLGNMAIRASHYVGKMGDDGSFLGFVPMNTRTTLPESAYAGQMMATVVQYFWHENPYSGIGKHPYKYYKNKSLPNTALWFLDKEVAEDGRGKYEPYQRYNIADDANGYPKIGKFMNRVYPIPNDRKGRADKSLVRFIDEKGSLGQTKRGPDKFEYAFRPQWIVPSSSGLSPLPPQNSTNDVGKAVWIYRFPKQLDETLDADQIQHWIAMHGVDYSMANTKEAYGFPSYKDKNKKWSFRKKVKTMENYSILGRMEDNDYNPLKPSSNNSLDTTNKTVAEVNNQIFMTRKEIPVIPMIDSHFEKPAGIVGGYEQDLELKTYFDTSSKGASLGFRLTDPERYAYLSHTSVNHVFFPQKSFSNIGDQFLVIGQALIPYDENSIDSNLNTFQSSERMMLATGNEVTTDIIYRGMQGGFRSVEENPTRATLTNLGARNWDYMVPKVVVTTTDLENSTEPPGYQSLVNFVSEYGGVELTSAWVESLELKNPATGTQSSSRPAYYDINIGGSIHTFPYSIALFEIYQGYQGPILELDEEGKAITGKPGNITVAAETPEGRKSDAKFYYFTQTGKFVKQDAYFHKTVTESTGVLEDDLETPGFTDPSEDVTVSFLEENAANDAWLTENKNKLFVIPGSWDNYFIPGSDRVTGQQIFDAWVDSGGAFDLPMMDSNNFAGLGNIPFKKTFGVEVIDVTQKWGELGMNRSRYTGDMNFQAVQAPTDVGAEQLGYVAFEATHSDLGNPLDDVGKKLDSALDTAKDAAAGGAGMMVGGTGGLILGAGLGAIFVAALAVPAAIGKVKEKVEDSKQYHSEEQRQLPPPK
jgi:hypothetical protein